MMPPSVFRCGAAGRALLALLVAASPIIAANANPAVAPQDCPPYVRHAPGGDYNNPADRQGLALVEFHFPPQVESLAKGVTGPLGGDIGYTLEHFPNHPRALAAMARLGLRDKSVQPAGAKFSVRCFFERAIGFVPGDARVRTMYGAYLLALGEAEAAMAQLSEAVRLDPDNATGNYNLGLLYLNKKDYAAARRHAQKAYALGFPLPGLKNRLSAAGQWPPEAPALPQVQAPAATPAAQSQAPAAQAQPPAGQRAMAENGVAAALDSPALQAPTPVPPEAGR